MSLLVLLILASSSYSCIEASSAGSLELFIYNGHRANPENHKHLVKLFGGGNLCTGSILTHRWILTCAHCFIGLKNSVVTIEVSHYHSHRSHIIAHARNNHIITHTGFNPNQNNIVYDLALIKTLDKINFDQFVKPIHLASAAPQVGTRVTIAGYGQTEATSIYDDRAIPREGTVVITPCVRSGQGTMCSRCTRTYCGRGDSGGPVTQGGRLVGVNVAVCFPHEPNGHTCQDIGFYSSVAHNAQWINSIIHHHQ